MKKIHLFSGCGPSVLQVAPALLLVSSASIYNLPPTQASSFTGILQWGYGVNLKEAFKDKIELGMGERD